MNSLPAPTPDRDRRTGRRRADDPAVELLREQLSDAQHAAAQLAAEAARERDARAALAVHVAELERKVRELEADLVARRGSR